MATAKCVQCSKPVYPLERMVLADKVFHKGCAKCAHCQGTLSISSFSTADGKLFCKPHYMELFKAAGGKYAFSTDGPAEKPTAAEIKAPVTREITPSKRLSRVASMLTGSSSSAEKEKSVKKDANRWVKDMFSRGTKTEKAEKQVNTHAAVVEVTEETPAPPAKMTAPERMPAVVVKTTSLDELSAPSVLNMFMEPPKSAPATEHSAATKQDSVPTTFLEPQPVVDAAKTANAQIKDLESKPEQIAEAKATSGFSKLSAFLSNPDSMIPADQKSVPEVIREKPVTVDHVAPAKDKVVSVRAEQGVSKLSMFLQQAEVPGTTISVVPHSNVLKQESEVVKEKQVSVQELVKKTITKPAENISSKAVSKPAATPRKLDAPRAFSPEKSSSKDKILAIKRPLNSDDSASNERLMAEMDSLRTRMKELESENEALRAHLELSDAGKEALVQEIDRLNAELSVATKSSSQNIDMNASKSTSIADKPKVVVAASENSIDQSLKHAKKLLSQGKITKAQYEAAARACAEANRVIQN